MQRHAMRLGRIREGFALLIIGAALAYVPSHVQAQTSSIPSTAAYACDFENGYCDFSEQSKVGDFTGARSTIVSTSRSGSHGVRLHTEPGDDQVHGSGTWERDDLIKSPDATYCNEGQEEWWAVSILFPSDYVYPPGPDGGVVLDFHHNSSSGLPNFEFDTMPGNGLRIRGQGGAQINGGQYTSWFNDPYGAGVGQVTRNVWYDFVFHIKWSATSAGFSEAWLNGKKIHTYSGATLYSGISCYLKLANYHGPFGQPSSIIFDRVVRGASAADVAMGPLDNVVATPSTPTPSPTPTNPPAAGSASVSATMDSSSYTIAAGQSVTFTARMLGNSGTPTGTVVFKSDGNAIAGCSGVALANGTATCTTSGLNGGSHAITGTYSGDSTYGNGQAGPITETVTGSTPTQNALPVSFGMDSSSYTIAAGQSVTFTASIPGSGGTVQFQDNGAALSGCGTVGVSSSGLATCTTASLSSGTHAIRALYSGNGGYAAGIAGPITQIVNAPSSTPVTQPTTPATGTSYNVQGLWWQPSESGWGVNLSQQGDTLFATWFTYDDRGNGLWLVMAQGTKTGDNTYTGVLYQTTGPSYASGSFDPSQVTRTPVGNATFSFTDGNNGTLTAMVNGSAISKQITRQVFQSIVPTCSEGASAGSILNFQDLWWRTAGSESGWGLNIAHQSDVLFVTWFTYDADGTGMWLVASNVAKTGNNTYSGTLYRTWGPAFNAVSFDASSVQRIPVGQVTLSFTDAANGTFTYTVNGVTGQKPITRQVFSTPATMCQ